MSAAHLRWQGHHEHVETYALSLRDPRSGWGAVLRCTVLSPLRGVPVAELSVLAGHGDGRRVLERRTVAIEDVVAQEEPFALWTAEGELTDGGWTGAAGAARWALRWRSAAPPEELLGRRLRRARLAPALLELPHPALEVSGTLSLGAAGELRVERCRTALVHAWGPGRGRRFAWAHAPALGGDEEASLHLASVQTGPRAATAVVARVLGEELRATGLPEVARGPARFGAGTWSGAVSCGARRLAIEVAAPPAGLAGMVLREPDEVAVHCYNSQVATVRVTVLDRRRGRPGRVRRADLAAEGGAYAAFGSRAPLPGLEPLG